MKSLAALMAIVAVAAWLFWPRSHELAPGTEPRCEKQMPRYCPDPYHVEHGNGLSNAVNP